MELLTPRGLAFWIMDDGSWVGSGIKISTHSFTLSEVELLINVLSVKFGLACTIQKGKKDGQWLIYIKAESIPKLRELTSCYFHNSMLYK